MELSQGQIIKKPNKQDLSSFFMTHRFNVMNAPVKFHKYIPYGFRSYGPDMNWDGRTCVRTYVRTGRTGVTLNTLPLFLE